MYEITERESPVYMKQSHVKKKRRIAPPPIMVADRKGNVRTYYMVGSPMPVHDPLVLSNINKVNELMDVNEVTIPRGNSLSNHRRPLLQ
jgi:hypothetical protein